MKKKFKKRFFGISLAALMLVLPFCGNKGMEKVKADLDPDACKTYTNYYFFLDVRNWNSTPDYTSRGTNTVFKSELPGVDGNAANSDDYIKNQQLKWLNLANSEDGWSIAKFYDKLVSFDSINKKEGSIVVDSSDSSVRYYYHDPAFWWEDNGDLMDTSTDPGTSKAALVANSYYAPINTELSTATIGIITNSNVAQFAINRQWNASEYSPFMASIANRSASAVGGKNASETDGHVFVPALLKVTYDMCSGALDEDERDYEVTKKFVDKNNNTIELLDSVGVESGKVGTEFSTDCVSEISASHSKTGKDYVLSSSATLSGTIKKGGNTVYCEYTEKPSGNVTPTDYKVITKYLDKDTKKQIKPETTINFIADGQNYKVDCTESIDKYILSSTSGNLTGKINGNDVTVMCYYTNKSVQTSDIPIYLVWAIGGAALAYSVYYFRKYYKAQNEV